MAKCEEIVRIMSPFFDNLQRMETKLKCPVCSGLLENPQLLPCGHMICRDCVPIEKSLACPVCDKKFLSKDVKPALHAEEMVNIFKYMDNAIGGVINMSHQNDTSAQDSDPTGIEGSHLSGISNTSCETKYEIPDFVRDKVEEVRKQLRIQKLSRVMRVAGELSWNKWDIESVVDKLYLEFEKRSKKGHATRKRLNDIATSLAKNLKDLNYNFPPRERISPLDMWFDDSNGQDRGSQGQAEKRPLGQPSSPPSQENRSADAARISARRVTRSQARQGSAQLSSLIGCIKLTEDCESDESASSDSCEEIEKENDDRSKRIKLDKTKTKRRDTKLRSTPVGLFEDECVFCHSFKLLRAPGVYYAGDQVKNFEKEIKRGTTLICSKCGVHGAVLGCFYTPCRKTFHATCALELPDCRWDTENFNMLCPAHACKKLKCDDSSPINYMDTSQENIQVNEETRMEEEEGKLVPEESDEINDDFNRRTKAKKKTSNLFTGLGFYLSCYLSCSIKNHLEEIIIDFGGIIMKEKDLFSSNSNRYLIKYFVYEDSPKDLNSDYCEKIRVERTKEVEDFATKTGSSRIVGYMKIYEAISSLQKEILDEN